MSFDQLTAGKDIPNDVNVVIEIPADNSQVKYEVDKDTGLLIVDRFMPTAMHYPLDYGYIPATLAEDGDPVDVLVMTPFPIQAGCMIRCRIIGVLRMTDEAGPDSKMIAIPIEKICKQYAHIQSLDDIPQITRDSIVHFFEHYKDLEPEKWVKLAGWGDKAEAAGEIEKAVKSYNKG